MRDKGRKGVGKGRNYESSDSRKILEDNSH